MSQIAIDVVLLPPEEAMQQMITLNKKLLAQVPDGPTILDNHSCLPHITLVMGCIDSVDMERVQIFFHKVAKNVFVLPLVAQEVYTGQTPKGDYVSGLKVENTPTLQTLHEQLMDALAPFLLPKPVLESLYDWKHVDPVTLHWVKSFPKTSNYTQYSPHITLGIGQAEALDTPIEFTADTLALCHLGNYCTCRDIFEKAALRKKIA